MKETWSYILLAEIPKFRKVLLLRLDLCLLFLLLCVRQILVNNRTASASEIVAAALHNHCKAILVGDRTYGKGLIQSVFELHDGSGVVVTIGMSHQTILTSMKME